MATAKQIAARKLFAQRAKAGTLRKNPAKKKLGAKRATSVKRAKKAVSAPSQITKRAPTKRLKARRAANSKPGYFPNPISRGFKVKSSTGSHIATFNSKADAVEYAQALANKTGKGYSVES